MSVATDLKESSTELAKAFEDFKSSHAEQLKEIKNRKYTDVVLDEKIARIDSALHELQAKKDKVDAELKRLDELEKKLNRPGGGDVDVKFNEETQQFNVELKAFSAIYSRPQPATLSGEDYKAYKVAFDKFLRKGPQALDGEEYKAMSVGSDPDGGYLVEADTSGRVARRVYEMSPIRQISSVQQISTDALEGLNDIDQAGDMVMVAETTAPAETGTPKLGKWRIPVWTGYVEPRVTQQLLDDAAVNVDQWLANKVADRIARGQNRRFAVGTGSGEPWGIFSYTTSTTADDTRTWNQLQHVNTGVNGDFAGSNPSDVLFDILGQFKDSYLQNARWLTRREVITRVRKFKENTNNYLWQPGIQAGQPAQLLGFPVTIAQDTPVLGTGSLSMAFGDFREGYQIVDRLGLTTIRDNLTSKPYVKFYTRTRFGGGVVNFEAIKFVRFGS